MDYHRFLRLSLLLAGLVAAIWIYGACANPALQGSLPANPAEVDTATPAATPMPEPQEPLAAGLEDYKGMVVGFTAEGYPFRGAPDAPITVVEYSDYQCPFCARHVTQTEPALDENYVRAGKAKFVFRDLPLDQLHPNARGAAVAALCVADQGSAARFWEMHKELFNTQDQWANLADPGDFFSRLVEEIGADLDVYDACVANGDQAATVEQSVADARSLGFSGTPSFQFVRTASGDTFSLVGAQPYDAFENWMDTLLAGGTPVDPQQAQGQQGDAQMPFWATAEGLAPDPDRSGYTVAGDQYKGNPDASVAVVEFSDFQCPYCRQHVLDTQPALDEQFVDTDRVFWVFKHFPIESIHPYAPAASVAAECAGEQGRFWEMHNLLFVEMDLWAGENVDVALIGLAEQLELDMDAYQSCQVDEEIRARVDSDVSEGAPFIRGTPTFVVLYGGQGRLIPGALPADQFVPALEQMLEEAQVGDEPELQ